MDIKDILDSLGLDLTNPEVKRGAMEAIEAILSSRHTSAASVTDSSQEEIDIDIDPDLLQPSIKNQTDVSSEEEPEINDEENLLDQVKHNENEDDDNEDSELTQDSSGSNNNDSSSESDDETSDTAETNLSDADSNAADSGNDDGSSDNGSGDSGSSTSDDANDNTEDSSSELESADEESADEASTTDEEDDSDDFDIDDVLDNDLQNTYKDADIKAKENARRIKRERTLQAAKNALSNAINKKANASLIKELEKAIAGLESLQEAAGKKLSDISDEEFNMMINRVFDAIDALGDSGLTYSTDEERQLKAKEIKTDLASNKTQTELSAEDIAQIRAETQAVKARDKELNKNKPRSAESFKGFQDFLNSLYRAVAMQVKINEIQDDSWSAINRRYSGSGVLQPGKKINELPDGKIPIIDFYFDCSGSWGPKDIQVGKKAVEALRELEEKGQIKINLYYFGDRVSSDPDGAGGGTSGWNEIVKNVIATQATNVIIMTDMDMESWWVPQNVQPLRYTVPGYVWYLWRDGENAPRLPRDLKGRGGTQQFSFSRGDV